MSEAPGTHNPQFLPPGIPVPQMMALLAILPE